MAHPPRRWLIYALGGGMGHLTRALAIARQAIRRDVTVHLVCNGPATPDLLESDFLRAAKPRLSFTLVDRSWDARRASSEIVAELARRPADLLLVDTFPRGLGGELAGQWERLPGAKVLVHRDLNPRYVERYRLREWVAKFDFLFLPGERGPLAEEANAFSTAPWLICRQEDMLTRDAARGELKIPGESRLPVVVVVGSGMDDERLALARLTDRIARVLEHRATVRFVTTDPLAGERSGERWISCWPLMRLHAGIDLVVGSGGYNTVHECRATGVPLVAMSRKRLYDRQARRLSASEAASDEEDVIDKVNEHLKRPAAERPRRFVNGVERALEELAERGLA